MNAKQLRDSILQMAIQGKLVPQDPNEEPASELLKKIKAEKEQLIKDKKIKKDKNESTIFRGKDGLFYETIGEETKCIQEEIPFDIPNSWEWCRLYEIATKNIKRGKSPVYTEKSSIKVFAQKCNQKNGQINLDIALYLDETKLMKYDLSEFMEYGDTVINSTGGGTMGRVGFYDIKEPIKIVPDSHVTVIRTGVSTEKKYVYHYIKTKQVYLENYGDGSTNQKELKPETIMNLIVPLPPLAEQKRIVEEIEKIYSKIALFDK